MDHLEIVQEEEDTEEPVDNLFVPDVNSNDPEERKLARRIRIQKRIEAEARHHKGAEQLRAERAAERVNLLQRQLEQSSNVLNKLFKEAEFQVTNVRVANDRREVDRREADGVRHKRIYAQLQEDAKLSMEMFNEITGKWTTITAHNDPLSIHDDLLIQREKFEELMRQKDTVIAMLKQEVRQAESRYYLDHQAQNADIHLLAKRVERQVTLMRAAHGVELEHIEDIMILERSNLMENNEKRWNEMYRRRKEQEMAISDYKVQQQKDFEETVSRARIGHYEKIRDIRITFERRCAILRQELENMKTSMLINFEKLDYNYQILRKREDENIIIKSNQKRLLNKLQDNINNLRKKKKDYEERTKGQINKLISEIFNLQRSINNEKKKSKAVSLSNDQKYMDIWELNRRAARKHLKRITGIDKLLYEQQLGVTWREPNFKMPSKEKLPSFKAAVKFLEALRGTNAREQMKRRKPSVVAAELTAIEDNIGSRRLFRVVLEKLAHKPGFLYETKMKEILGDTTSNETLLVKVDSILEALGIGIPRDINVMLHYFRPYIYCPLCSPRTTSYEDDDDPDALSANTILTQGDIADGSMAAGHDTAAGSTALTTTMGAMTLDGDLRTHECDDVVDKIIASVVHPKRLRGSTSKLDLIQKEGECVGPGRMLADDKKQAQMDNQVTVMGHTTSISCLLNHPLYMNPAKVTRALHEFVFKAKCKIEPRNTVSSDTDLAVSVQTVSRLLDKNEVKEHWERYKVILKERTSDLWDALMYGLKKYHMILEERHRMNKGLKKLQQQNQELQFLLKRFGDDISRPPRGWCKVADSHELLNLSGHPNHASEPHEDDEE